MGKLNDRKSLAEWTGHGYASLFVYRCLRCSKRNVLTPLWPRVGEGSHEQRLASHDAFTCTHDFVPEATAAGRITKDRLHFDAGGHVHHRPRFSDNGFAWIESHLHVLRIIAVDAVVDLVGYPLLASWRLIGTRHGITRAGAR